MLSRESLGQSSVNKNMTWSTTKLFELEITDSKDVNNQLLVKVHYLDEEWTASKYDAWVAAKDIIDIPQCFVKGTSEQRAFFLSSLRLLIKENLHVQRNVDTVVNIELPIQRSLFETKNHKQ